MGAQAEPHTTPLITQTAAAFSATDAPAEATAQAPITDDATLIEIIVDVLPGVTAPIVAGMGDAFERSTLGGAVMWLVFGVVVVVVAVLLYRSTPPARREDIGRELASGTSSILKQIDAADPLKWTDIENRILTMFSTLIDQAVASGIQAAIEAEKKSQRDAAAAKIANGGTRYPEDMDPAAVRAAVIAEAERNAKG